MHIHILGIAGTFMAGLAVLAKELGFKITGSDQAIYPPMSTQLAALGIDVVEGYDKPQWTTWPDCIVVGNVMRRGIPIIEELLDKGARLYSGPEWLAQFVLQNRHVIAISGTHGKTTTSSMVAWILEVAGLSPGFLIGGVPNNFGISARIGKMPFFVIEADEYDSAFFDKRSKFIHYRPRTLIINNIEYDHADIFPNLAAIEQQFHHLVRTVPRNGLIIYPASDLTVARVLKMGAWTPLAPFNTSREMGWHAKLLAKDGHQFEIYRDSQCLGEVQWGLLGDHNVSNALAAIIAAEHLGVAPEFSAQALSRFSSVKRRLEIKGRVGGVTVYDDFAHHPTAISTTLSGLRAKVGDEARIIAVVEIRSNSMRAGHHKEHLASSLKEASETFFLKAPEIDWEVDEIRKQTQKPGAVFTDVDALVATLKGRVLQASHKQGQTSHPEDAHVIFMSNGGFGGIQRQFLEALEARS